MTNNLLISFNELPLDSPEFIVVYERPLDKLRITWTTKSFDSLMRMYANLTMNKLKIVSITISQTTE